MHIFLLGIDSKTYPLISSIVSILLVSTAIDFQKISSLQFSIDVGYMLDIMA